MSHSVASVKQETAGPQQAAGSSTAADCFVRLNSDLLHDLASPVNQIKTLTEMFLKKYRGALDEDAEVMLQHLLKSAGRLDNLVSGLRTYLRTVGTRQTQGRSEASSLLADGLASIRGAIEQHAAVVIHEPLPVIECDPRQISCVFANLVDNAIKFRSEQKPEVHIAALREGNFWKFSIRDNGIGIDRRNWDRIFSVFKRINNGTYTGSGVGLAISKQIVEEHGGRIWVESQIGSGATFYFTLPAGEIA